MPDKTLTPNRPEYYVQTGSMFENPHGVPHDEIVQYVLENPSEVVAQVVFGKYVESSGLVFTGEMIQNMIDRKLQRVTGDAWIDTEAANFSQLHYRPKDARSYAGGRYKTGIDFARQTDYTVLSTIDVGVRPARLVYYKRLNRVPWETIYTEVGRARALWGPDIIADRTGMGGDVVMDALESRSYCPVHERTVMHGNRCTDRFGAALGGCTMEQYLPLSCVEGFEFQAASKKQLIENLRNCMAHGYRAGSEDPFGLLRIPPIVQVEEEMSFYTWDDKKLTTDALMSLALAAWIGLEDVVADALVGSPFGT